MFLLWRSVRPRHPDEGDGAEAPSDLTRRGSQVQPGTPGKLRLIIKDNYPAVNNYSVIKV